MRLEKWIYTVPLRLRSLFRRAETDRELDEELRDHVESRTEEYAARGLTALEARRAALLEMGGMERRKEECREERHVHWIQDFIQDMRYGLRVLGKSPGFTIVAVLTLALGIGANTAIFSLIEAVILRPLPYPQSDRIVHFGWMDKTLIPNLSIPEFEFFRDHAGSFSALAGFQGDVDQELNGGTGKHWVTTAIVTDGFFETLGVHLQLGRPFGREFTRAGGANAAVLTDPLWRSAFASDRDIIGRQIILDNQPYTVAGVLPPGFTYTEHADVFASLHFDKSLGNEGLNTDVIGRLKPRVSLSQAQAEARLLGGEFFAQAPAEQRQGSGVLRLDRFRDYLASDYRATLLMLLSAVGLLLLIACANVASLLLTRAASRQTEICIRLALGAGRRRLLQQFLSEGLLLAMLGAVAGLAAAFISLRVFVSAIPWDLPSVDRIGLDGATLFFTSLVGIAVTIVFGLTSFFQTRKLDLNVSLKDSRAVAGVVRSRRVLMSALVVGEVAISLVLALGAGLLIESLYNLQQEKLGFNPQHILLMQTPFGPNASDVSILNFERQALDRIQAIPGVQSVALVSVAPLHGQGNIPVQRDAHPEDSIGGTELRTISPGYFSTMSISILRGRAFQQSDLDSSAPVAIINETLARDWWPGDDPIAGRVVIGEYQGRQYLQMAQAARQVIGVVADTKGMLLGRPAPPMVYVPATQGSFTFNGSTDWVIRASAAAGVTSALRDAIAAITPDQRILDLEPMTQLIKGSAAESNFQALLMGTFGALALILTLVGVYGVFSFQVVRRTHEIGLRMALGASHRDIWRLVIGNAAKLAIMGIVAGMLAGFALTRLMKSLLFNVRPTDPVVFGSVAILVLCGALLAAYIPAWRAMRVDPMVALRYE